MIFDARSLPVGKTIETDVCIVGAGVAGITLAREFMDRDFRVCLLESGGLEPDKVTQSLYWGENIGHPYYPLDTARARLFGGSSHYWHVGLGDHRLGVRLRGLDEIDFEKRDWIPYSGWPFNKTHLDPFYERAHAICQIGPYTYDVEDWEDPVKTPRLPFTGDRVNTTIFHFGFRDIFYKEYREEIDRNHNITTYLNANVIDIETTKTAQAVTRLCVACLGGKKFLVTAKLFILAMGALEIPRLLLLSNKVQRNGLGNQNDLVGRFFMEHPHLWSGIYVPPDSTIFRSAGLYQVHRVKGIPIMGKLTLSDKVLRQEKLLNYCVSLHPRLWPNPHYQDIESKGVDSIRTLRSTILAGNISRGLGKHISNVMTDIDGIAQSAYRRVRRSRKVKAFRLNHMSEQIPNPDSRVTLADEHDALGLNRIQLDWRLSPVDMRSVIRSQEIIDEELRHAGLGRLYIEMHDETPPSNLTGGWHHMGTTRMHRDTKKGVVDENCLVHGMSNLFIAGPSVFPTCGYANPVLTTIALSVRLADHVKKLMS